ncbi:MULTISPECIES: heme exporter protein CcmD [unclassified Bradyrhizobium]|uniref:heme exporter protein CcmD n=1 Tax=unclassified Bradyrhizobium TaxID=2631580 RepID=UPI001CD236D5|nr:MULTISPECIES: heme exporter protein CcmD [unclassified Bradyrhizobium]MCA1430925.1 heme exporter protein CcmD [Bradyrhizobium sp. NBAIM16]MCA1508999.1 heme exporter protein CcmD [Bradyrhizobium sp. NBAIM02]MCA1516276.1 heme exporter protein CcmD [Bradyrhizobium sp. NBAIM01]
MTMSLGPYATFIVASYAAVALVVAILIGWVMLDYRSQTQRLRELEQRGITRRSGRSATELR